MGNVMPAIASYAAYMGVCAALLVAATFIYVSVTPYREFALVREGNVAASISLSGAMVGFALALHGASANTVSLVELIVWGAVALASQLLAFAIVRLVLRDLKEAIEGSKVSYGITLAAFSIAVGLLNVGSITY